MIAAFSGHTHSFDVVLYAKGSIKCLIFHIDKDIIARLFSGLYRQNKHQLIRRNYEIPST